MLVVKRSIFWLLLLNTLFFVHAAVDKPTISTVLKVLETPIDKYYFEYGEGYQRRNYYYGTIRQDKHRGKNLVPLYAEKLYLIGDYKIQMLVVQGILQYRCEYDIEYYVFTADPTKALLPFYFNQIPPKVMYDGSGYQCNNYRT